ncbi:polysaccharide biosynthesis protein [Candidatus Woesearchaeota archaeon]|nr:polysaccharide biosynthesis protein [Candidatus Woesearchaeota archaeon]
MSTMRNAAYVLSAQTVLLLSGTIISLGLGRYLGPELYGKYGVILSVATVMNIILTPGITQAIAKFVAEKKEDAGAITAAMLKRQLATGLLLTLLYFAMAIPLTAALKDKSLLQLLWILTPMALIYGTTAAYSGYLTGLGKFFEQSAQLIIYSTSRLLLTFILAYFFSLAGAIAALPASALIALAYTAIAAKPKAEESQTAAYPLKRIYKLALPIAIFSGLITIFMSTDLLMVQALLHDAKITGYYTAASTVARIPFFVLTALGMVMLPTVAKKLASRQDSKIAMAEARMFVQRAIRYVLMLLLPGTAVIIATAKLLAMLLYGSGYAHAAQPLAILAAGTAAMTLAYLLATVLNASGKSATAAAISAVMLIATVAANIIAIPQYGMKGAAIAMTAASIAGAIIFAAITRMHIGKFVKYGSLLKITAASVVLFAIAKAVPLQNKFLLPVEYAVLGLIYIIMLAAMGEISSKDVKDIKASTPFFSPSQLS